MTDFSNSESKKIYYRFITFLPKVFQVNRVILNHIPHQAKEFRKEALKKGKDIVPMRRNVCIMLIFTY